VPEFWRMAQSGRGLVCPAGTEAPHLHTGHRLGLFSGTLRRQLARAVESAAIAALRGLRTPDVSGRAEGPPAGSRT
jgi:hypothetical protein